MVKAVLPASAGLFVAIEYNVFLNKRQFLIKASGKKVQTFNRIFMRSAQWRGAQIWNADFQAEI